MNASPIIIDTGSGIDDAAAITLLATDPGIEVRLIASVYGRASVQVVATRVQRLLPFLGERIPVAGGAAAPLTRPAQDAGVSRDVEAAAGIGLPAPDRSLLCERSAVLEEHRILMESERPITLVTFGPLTNVALLLTAFPEVRDRIEQVVMMIGSTGRGDVSAYGEFNAVCDPEAAGIVFRSGLPLVMAGLDVGRMFMLGDDEMESLEACGKVGSMLGSLLRTYVARPGVGVGVPGPAAAMYLLEPGLFTTRQAKVAVEVASPLTLGATVVEFGPGRYARSGEGSAVTVCVDADSCGFRASFLDRMKRASAAGR
ncbi:nucleoside hydrolase [Bifidobacterium xylocopae]|uniref:Ribonucleoside hydrolase RihC n=1 Tax=Bifidobacterium xylocopae TaxID=2493119 RepID=A0A366KB47_9BIFI|nr:nucleoside hydrolase [Bifidobacterium xylocopae]RBP98940.1 ribonucleoside hydrolase RihC [Bifidobacterium xylocopae]